MLALALLLVGCQDDVATTEITDDSAKVDNVVENGNTRNAKKELNWILNNNETLHSPSDDLARIVDYNTGEPLGVSMYYDMREDFDPNKYKMNIKIGDIEGQFALGWHAPNVHDLYMDNTTPVHSVSEEQPLFIQMSDLMFETMYESPWMEQFKPDSFLQVTAADIDDDNALEFIFYGIAPNDETSWNDVVIEVYEYYPEQSQPFERVLQLKESVYSGVPIKITPAGEIVIDVYRGEEYVVALCKNNEWYVVDEYYQNTGEHSANRISYTSEDKFDFKNAWRSEQNKWRQQCKKKKCNDEDFPMLNKEDGIEPENESSAASETVVETVSDDTAISQAYSEEDLIQYINDYVRLSAEAKNSGDFSIVEGYISPGSPVYKDMVKSVPATFKKGITIDYQGTVVEKISIDTDHVYFTVVNTFEIFNSTYDGPVSFRSQYKVYVNGDSIQVEELLSDEKVD